MTTTSDPHLTEVVDLAREHRTICEWLARCRSDVESGESVAARKTATRSWWRLEDVMSRLLDLDPRAAHHLAKTHALAEIDYTRVRDLCYPQPAPTPASRLAADIAAGSFGPVLHDPGPDWEPPY